MSPRVCIASVQAKTSEGAAYNVVSNVPKDDTKLREVEARQQRGNLTRVRHAVEHYSTQAAAAAAERGQRQRCLAVCQWCAAVSSSCVRCLCRWCAVWQTKRVR